MEEEAAIRKLNLFLSNLFLRIAASSLFQKKLPVIPNESDEGG